MPSDKPQRVSHRVLLGFAREKNRRPLGLDQYPTPEAAIAVCDADAGFSLLWEQSGVTPDQFPFFSGIHAQVRDFFEKYPPGCSSAPHVESSQAYDLVRTEIGERALNDWYDVEPVTEEVFEDIPDADFIVPSGHRSFHINPSGKCWEVRRYDEWLAYADTRLDALGLAVKLCQANIKSETQRRRRSDRKVGGASHIIARLAAGISI